MKLASHMHWIAMKSDVNSKRGFEFLLREKETEYDRFPELNTTCIAFCFAKGQ